MIYAYIPSPRRALERKVEEHEREKIGRASSDSQSRPRHPRTDDHAREDAERIAAQMPDTAPGPYYISVMKDSGDWRAVSGPYPLHATALGLVDKARRICEGMDSRAFWYAFGTVRIKDGCTDPGILQKSGYNLALEREAA